MKNLNKLIRILQSYYCLGLYFGILQAQVVITEFFINSAEGTQIPQYIELYNTRSDTTYGLVGWSIITKNGIGEESSFSTQFTSTNTFASYAGDPLINIENCEIIHHPFEIQSHGYFLISSTIGGNIFSNNHNSDIEVLFILSEAGSIYLYEPGNSDPEDQVSYDISDSNWPIKTGYSMILQLSDDTWSLSPETENSEWLYEGSEILNFGSPREENAFKLNNIQYFNTVIDSGRTHIISGDVNNIYNADNNYEDNNFNDTLLFSWVGTFIEDPPALTDLKYEIIIEKKVTSIDSISFLMYNTSAINTTDTIRISNNTDTTMLISPLELLIDPLGMLREIAEYSWTVELTKTFSNDSTDTIYSDKYIFTIDASDYGRYGCVDNGCCTNDPNEVGENDGCPRLCPTNAYYEPYISNHPIE